MKNLDDIRKQINEIDMSLVELFEKRMEIVHDVAKSKIITGKPIYDAKREDVVVSRAVDATKNTDITKYTKQLFEQLMAVSKEYQKTLIPIEKIDINKKVEQDVLSVGFQGVFGSFSDSAVDQLYNEKIIRKNFQHFEDLFVAVSNGEVEEGVVPYENTSTGGVNDVLDLLREYNLYIVSQIDVKVNHCLLGVKGSKVDDLLFVYSHPQALSQCSRFFKDHQKILPYPYTNTAAAAKDISIWHEMQKGAIASLKASKLYNLEVLKENIQDYQLNTTRFIVVKKQLEVDVDANKTSIVFASAHVPGALYNILKSFYNNNINITRIESRPNITKKFEYYFFVDFEGTVNDEHVNKALDAIKNHCLYFKLLGSYNVKGASQ